MNHLLVATILFALAFVVSPSATAQVQLQHGDVLVSTSDEPGVIDGAYPPFTGYILAFGRDGAFKGELIRFPDSEPGDLLYSDGVLYAIRRPNIERIDSTGGLLAPLTTDAPAGSWLSPGPAGSLVAVGINLYQFAADGTRIRREFAHPIAFGGIDLAPDGCTLFGNPDGYLKKWDACVDSPVTSLGVRHGLTGSALRLLRDGTLLVQALDGRSQVRHLDRNGSMIRSYLATSIALDIDGRSFWTSRGCRVARIDIATGVVLTVSEPYPACVNGLFVGTVVGEPRAGLPAAHASEPTIPTLTPALLVLLSIALATAAWSKTRTT